MKKMFRNTMVVSCAIVSFLTILFFWEEYFSRSYVSEDDQLLVNLITRVNALETRNELILTQSDKRILITNETENKPTLFNQELIARVEKIEYFIAEIEHIEKQNINTNSQNHRETLENVTNSQNIEEYLNNALSEVYELNTVE